MESFSKIKNIKYELPMMQILVHTQFNYQTIQYLNVRKNYSRILKNQLQLSIGQSCIQNIYNQKCDIYSLGVILAIKWKN
ncbi:unnamed protein product [Paramecium sonneborni]|uniref:Uncharacterized protein n=1 Tax=Paramecium sonneborni TaxID=65129 RepID=A0A8S1R634_9CILI|nr:unnamed protein product [Paramecium sonneborni]